MPAKQPLLSSSKMFPEPNIPPSISSPPPNYSPPLSFRSFIWALGIAAMIFLISEAANSSNIAALGLVILISIPILAFCVLLVSSLISLQVSDRSSSRVADQDIEEAAGKQGLEKMVIYLPPPMVYKWHETTWSCKHCAICMEDLLDGEFCRVLSTCKHAFHSICIDAWFNLHLTCPICRNSIAHL